jgi:hypothetical protein
MSKGAIVTLISAGPVLHLRQRQVKYQLPDFQGFLSPVILPAALLESSIFLKKTV